jgi:8-oxo-dGTP diphosphatase / 2-hydroxy-dATP diphosphatase
LEIKKVGVVDFAWRGKPVVIQVHIFSCEKFSGRPKETEEMRPEWIKIEKLDFKKMWADDEYWYPLFLAGKKFKGKFLFDDKDGILQYKLEEIKSL